MVKWCCPSGFCPHKNQLLSKFKVLFWGICLSIEDKGFAAFKQALLRYLLSLVSFCITIMWKMKAVDLVFIFSLKKNPTRGEKTKSHSRNQANSCTCLSTLPAEGNPPPPGMLPDNCLCDPSFILEFKEYFGFTCDSSSLQPAPCL